MRSWSRAVVAASIAVCIVLLAACSTGSGASRAEGSSSADALLASEGFPCRQLRVTRAEGTVTDSCVWVADTPALRSRGLMGVTDPALGSRGALAFASESDLRDAFWMVDTVVPLTVVWIDARGQVLGSADMEPCTTARDACPRASSPVPWRLAVEIPVGTAVERGLVPGSTVTLGDDC